MRQRAGNARKRKIALIKQEAEAICASRGAFAKPCRNAKCSRKTTNFAGGEVSSVHLPSFAEMPNAAARRQTSPSGEVFLFAALATCGLLSFKSDSFPCRPSHPCPHRRPNGLADGCFRKKWRQFLLYVVPFETGFGLSKNLPGRKAAQNFCGRRRATKNGHYRGYGPENSASHGEKASIPCEIPGLFAKQRFSKQQFCCFFDNLPRLERVFRRTHRCA